MKRLALAITVFAVALPAAAFKTTIHRGDRIGVIRPQAAGGFEDRVAIAVTRNLHRELASRGVDAIDTELTFEELRRDNSSAADYYIEVVRGDADSSTVGGIGIGDYNVGVDIAVVVARVAARLHLYDGRTLELVDTYDMQRRATAVMPTAIGVGRRSFGLWVALPFVQMARYRAAARAVAAEAAEAIIGETGREAPSE